MRKLIFLTLVITITITGIVFALSNVKATNKPRQEAPRITRGEDNPEAIPDHTAQEAFLRSLTATPGDEGENQRARAFAEQALGQDAESDQVDKLLSTAQDFVNRVSVLDVQAKDIKDRNWPEPSSAVMDQLAGLQTRKEALIKEVLDSLGKSAKVEIKDKIHGHIAEHVKRRITGTAVPLPGNAKDHQPGLGMIIGKVIGLIMPTASAQYMGQGYTYSNTSASNGQIYGYGATAESYSSNGHTYRITVNTYHPDGSSVSRTYPSSGSYSPPISVTNVLPLFRGGIWWTGFASTSTNGTGYCPMSSNYPFGMGMSSGGYTIAPYFSLGIPYFVTDAISQGQSTSYRAPVTASQGILGTSHARITAGYSATGAITITFDPTGEVVLGNFSAGQTQEAVVKFTATTVPNTVRVTARASADSPEGVTVFPMQATGVNNELTVIP